MSVEIRNLQTNPNATAMGDFLPVDTATPTITVKNTIKDVLSTGTGNSNTGTDSRVEGQNSTSSNVASHAEGSMNTASGPGSHAEGVGNISSGNAAHAEGSSTSATGDFAHVEGYGTTATGQATHAEGLTNNANADYSSVGGNYGTAYNFNEWARGSNFNNIDQSQYGIVSYIGQTANATPTIIYLDNTTAELAIQANSAYKCVITAIAYSTAGTASFTGSGTIKNLSGTVSLVAAITMTQNEHDGTLSATSIAVTADNTNKTLQVAATGIAATTINWLVKVEYTAVSNV